MKKSGDAKPKPKKDSDIVRERIIRRAALEFQDGMYGILFLEKDKHHSIICSESKQVSLFWIMLFCVILLPSQDPLSTTAFLALKCCGGLLESNPVVFHPKQLRHFFASSRRNTNNHLHSHSHLQTMNNFPDSPQMHVVGLWEEAEPHKQHPHRETPSLRLESAASITTASHDGFPSTKRFNKSEVY